VTYEGGPVAGCCEYGNKTTVTLKGGEFIHFLSHSQGHAVA
jgi:hypothetical protein